ncbi:MAG: DUF4430 domain-containing protein [Gaiellales bacterium]
MGARSRLGLVLTATAVAGCGSGVATPPSGPRAAIVTITRGFGQTTLTTARAAPGQSALDALRRSAHVSTSYGGRFVQAIDRLAGDQSQGMAWLYFVNGIQASVGSADYTLHAGDREWWDYRYWNDLIQVPVAIGAWPEPFVHGYGGKRPQVQVAGPSCAAGLTTALRSAGAHVVRRATAFSVRVETFARAAAALSASVWQGRGLTVSLSNGHVVIYRGRGGQQADPHARAVIAAYQPGPATGTSADVIVAGDTRASACAAAATLAERPASIRNAYAVALDGSGHVIAYGGRP